LKASKFAANTPKKAHKALLLARQTLGCIDQRECVAQPAFGLCPRSVPASLGTSHVGRCRRHAPTMNGYPVVYINDWCGDHRIDENKV
jgi:hypothetical protein